MYQLNFSKTFRFVLFQKTMAYLNNQNRWYILLVYTYIPFYEGDVKFIDPETATFFTRLSSEKINRYFVKRKLIFSALHIFLMVNRVDLCLLLTELVS